MSSVVGDIRLEVLDWNWHISRVARHIAVHLLCVQLDLAVGEYPSPRTCVEMEHKWRKTVDRYVRDFDLQDPPHSNDDFCLHIMAEEMWMDTDYKK